MRYLFLLFFVIATYGVDISKAQEEHDKAVAQADAKFAKYLVGVIKTAKDTEKVELYKLLAKYDPSNQEAAKFIAALGVTATEPDLLSTVKVITSTAASQIVKGYNAEKITEETWKSFPANELTVNGQKVLNTKITVQKGEVYLLCPSAVDKWQGGPGTPPSSFKGLQDVPWLAMTWTVQDASGLTLATGSFVDGVSQIACESTGVLFIRMGSPGPERVGSIRVKVFKIEK